MDCVQNPPAPVVMLQVTWFVTSQILPGPAKALKEEDWPAVNVQEAGSMVIWLIMWMFTELVAMPAVAAIVASPRFVFGVNVVVTLP